MMQTAAAYRRIVLAATTEVENGLAAQQGEGLRADALNRAIKVDEDAVELSLERYQVGKANFQRVLDSQQQLLQDLQDKILAQANAATQLVRTYKAAGGGWGQINVNAAMNHMNHSPVQMMDPHLNQMHNPMQNPGSMPNQMQPHQTQWGEPIQAHPQEWKGPDDFVTPATPASPVTATSSNWTEQPSSTSGGYSVISDDDMMTVEPIQYGDDFEPPSSDAPVSKGFSISEPIFNKKILDRDKVRFDQINEERKVGNFSSTGLKSKPVPQIENQQIENQIENLQMESVMNGQPQMIPRMRHDQQPRMIAPPSPAVRQARVPSIYSGFTR